MALKNMILMITELLTSMSAYGLAELKDVCLSVKKACVYMICVTDGWC